MPSSRISSIPYSGYGLFFLIRVLVEYFLRLSTVERLCERFSITLFQLRRWLLLFRVQEEEWLGALSFMETSALSFMKLPAAELRGIKP